MAFCINCGAKLPEGAKFCAFCGAPVAASQSGQTSAAALNFEAQENAGIPVTMDDLFADAPLSGKTTAAGRIPDDQGIQTAQDIPAEQGMQTAPGIPAEPDAPVMENIAEKQTKPAKSIITPVAVEPSRAKSKTKKNASSQSWIPIAIIILLFCIAIVVGVFKFKDLIFGKEAVAGPSDAGTVTTDTNTAGNASGADSDAANQAATAGSILPEETTGESADAQTTGENQGSPATEDGSASALPEENPAASDAAEGKEYPTWALTKENINIRSGAGTSFDKKSKYFRGTIVILYEGKAADGLAWYRVSGDGTKNELWIADDGTWLDFADPSAAALVGDDVTEEINFSMQYTLLAKLNDQYIWRLKTSQSNGSQNIILQNISDPAATEDFRNLIESDSSCEFLTFLWEQNDHKPVELKEITLAGYCRLSGADADGKAFTQKGEVWYAAIGSKTANYFATKDADGKLKIEETGLDKLFEAGWQNCTKDEYIAID